MSTALTACWAYLMFCQQATPLLAWRRSKGRYDACLRVDGTTHRRTRSGRRLESRRVTVLFVSSAPEVEGAKTGGLTGPALCRPLPASTDTSSSCFLVFFLFWWHLGDRRLLWLPLSSAWSWQLSVAHAAAAAAAPTSAADAAVSDAAAAAAAAAGRIGSSAIALSLLRNSALHGGGAKSRFA